jgi:hypothetical protein
MIIRHYIVSYKNEDILLECIEKISKAYLPIGISYKLNIISNSTMTYSWKQRISRTVKVLKNDLRLDSSTGHLARNWNQGLMLGFENLESPKADIVILSQGDCMLNEDFISKIVDTHKKYDFIQQGRGDEFHSYTAEHVKKAGIWDERFCGIGYQEIDYFYRSYILNKDNIYINHEFNNEIQSNENLLDIVDTSYLTGYQRKDESHFKSYDLVHDYCLNFILKKYGIKERLKAGQDCYKLLGILNEKARFPLIETYTTYPYFEKDLYKETKDKLRYEV